MSARRFAAGSTIALALRLALRYRDAVPPPAQLQADFGMSRATAYRWASLLRTATQAERPAPLEPAHE